MTGKTSDVRRRSGWFRRRLRSVAVLAVAAVAAPTALLATENPAQAAPVTVRVSGDAASRNLFDPTGGGWTYGGDYFSDLVGALDDQTLGEATFDFVAPVDEITDAKLAGIDVYIASAVGGDADNWENRDRTGYTAAEEAALLRFVQRGGVLIALTNSYLYNVTRFLGEPSVDVVVHDPPSHFDGLAPSNATAADPSHPLVAGAPTITPALTFTHFTGGMPDEAEVLYTYTHTCDETELTCARSDEDGYFNNNVTPARPIVAVVPFGTAQFGAGAIVMASDSDVFAGGPAAGHSLPATNLQFARNVFRWIGDHFASVDAPSDLAQFIDATYVTLLGRSVDPAGLAYWTSQFDNGMTRGQFAFAIANQPEWVNRVITGHYQHILGRAPDATGLAYWSNQIRNNGMRVASLVANLYASNEYFLRTNPGGDAGNWVDRLYDSILNRTPDASGRAYWIGQVNAGQPRQALANALFLSLESNAGRVEALYQAILKRSSDPAGRQYWAQQLMTLDDIALAAELVRSEEFWKANTAG